MINKQQTSTTYSHLFYILFGVTILLVSSYYSVRTINGMRAFTTGEAKYTKALQEACRHITSYVFTGDKKHYNYFLAELEVPINDSLARISMDQDKNDSITTAYLKKGRNDVDDIANMIWVYKNFRHWEHFESGINIWGEADELVRELQLIGATTNKELKAQPNINKARRLELANKIDKLCAEIVAKGVAFDKVIVTNIIFLNRTALTINVVLAIIFAASIIYLALNYIQKLKDLQNTTLQNNLQLKQNNLELELFTHSISHDLKAPIASLMGLVTLAETETDTVKHREYFDRMKQILQKQDDFILKIIQFSKNKQSAVFRKKFDLKKLVNAIVDELSYASSHEVRIYHNIVTDLMVTDKFRLEIVLRNLLANALKYADKNKTDSYVAIDASLDENTLTITIADNGIGIEEKHTSKVFDMFFVTSHHQKGSGIGLYLVKQMVEKLNGTIVLTSAINRGSTFILKMPVNRELPS